LEPLKLNLYQLLVFFHVANEKSMTLAAERLCLTQPTVSIHIKSLEESARMKLIEIKRKKLTLTPNGEVLYHYCTQIYNHAMAAQRFVDLMTTDSLNVGVSPIFVSAIACTVHAMYGKIGPSFKVQLIFGPAASLIKDVIDSRLDLAIVPSLDSEKDGLNHVRLSDGEKLFFFASPDNPAFQKMEIEWQDFGQLEFVMGHDAHLIKKMIIDKLAAEGIQTPPRINLTANNLECCKKLVKDGESISFSLIEDIQDEIKAGSLKTLLLPEDFHIKIDAVFNKEFMTSPLIQQFIDCARTAFLRDT
jgi:LysR family transcriptional regulator, transcriptional activator of the cysJI operon